MTWSYRVVRHPGPDGLHDIREVHFDANGDVASIGSEPANISAFTDWGDPRAALVWQLERALEAARDKPIVDMPAPKAAP